MDFSHLKNLAAAAAAAVGLFLSGCAPESAADPAVATSAGSRTAGDLTAGSAAAFDAAFQKTWSDGQAELASYDLEIRRYDTPRHGTALAIFVTETFSDRLRVKADPGKHPPSDEFPVMKLNLLRNYQTGIYGYNEMQSTFVALQPVDDRPSGSLVKSSYSVQEWCGTEYAQILFNRNNVRVDSHSYFDGEADRHFEIEAAEGAISEDGLLLWARRMAGPFLKAGDSTTLPVLKGLRAHLLDHNRMEWDQVRLTHLSAPAKVEVPAGTFVTDAYSATWPDDRTLKFYVERERPFRIVRWETSGGEQGNLVKSTRAQYWKMNEPEGVGELINLGLRPRSLRSM